MIAAHEACAEALQHPNVAAFLRVIREGESCQEPDAYWWLFGSTRKAPKLAESLSGHPRVKTFERYDGEFIKNGKLDYTTAAGAYQITASTWDTVVQPALQLPDFSPASQDLAAVLLIRKRGALPAVLAGQFAAACALLRNEWASMPGAQHGDQPTQSAQRALDVYLRYGGRMEGAQPEQGPPPEPGPAIAPDPHPITPAAPAPAAVSTEWDMQQQPPEPFMPIPAVLGALLPSLIEQAPQLIRIFGSGGAVSERNAKAAERVAEIARTVTAQTTTEGAVQVLQSDPAKAAEYREQVHMSMGELLGLVDRLAHLDEQEHARIESSRDAAAARAATEGDGEDAFLTRSLVGMMIAVMLGLAVLAGVLKWLGMDVQAIVGTLLTMVGVVGREFSTRIQYRYGSSRGSAAKDVVIDQISRRGPRG